MYLGTAFGVQVSYLPVQEESPGSRVWGDPSRDYITKVLRNTVGSRKDIRMERISVEVHDLYDSLV